MKKHKKRRIYRKLFRFIFFLGLVFFIRKYLLLPHDLAESMEAVEQYQCQQEQPHIHEQPPRQTSED